MKFSQLPIGARFCFVKWKPIWAAFDTVMTKTTADTAETKQNTKGGGVSHITQYMRGDRRVQPVEE